jgi:Glycosyl transferase family 2
VPASVADAARRRSEARADRDWQTADRLKVEIEAAGWRVIDAGLNYRLKPASPPSIEVGGEIRYGRSAAVPSRLAEPPAGLATVILVASEDAAATARSLRALDSVVPKGVDIVVVAGAVGFDKATDHEVVRTSAPLGRAAALNIGVRRARAPVVVLMDASIAPSGDVITPLVEALADPEVAVVGPVGLTSPDLRVFEEVHPTDEVLEVTAIRGDLIAFRRVDVTGLGAIDEAFHSGAYLDVWLSLLLRDTGEGSTPRRALAIPGLAIQGSVAAASVTTGTVRRDRDARRGFYRMLDRFRTRQDLAVPKRVVRSGTDS